MYTLSFQAKEGWEEDATRSWPNRTCRVIYILTMEVSSIHLILALSFIPTHYNHLFIDLQSFIDLVATPHAKKLSERSFALCKRMTWFRLLLPSLFSFSVYIWSTKSNIQATLSPPLSASLCSASCLFNCAPMSINLPRVKQTPLSSPLALCCPIWKRCWRLLSPNPLSGGINIALVHPLSASVLWLLCNANLWQRGGLKHTHGSWDPFRGNFATHCKSTTPPVSYQWTGWASDSLSHLLALLIRKSLSHHVARAAARCRNELPAVTNRHTHRRGTLARAVPNGQKRRRNRRKEGTRDGNRHC